MKRIVATMLAVALSAALWGCGGGATVQGPSDNPMEKKLWASREAQPDWIYNEPEPTGGTMFFVGLSSDQANQQLAREDARQNAAINAVSYMGTLAQSKFERARISYGLASDVENPTTSKKAFDKQLAANMANQLRTRSWYEERWQTRTGISYRAFVLAEIPRGNVEETYKETAGQMADQAAKQAKAENDNKAKAQMENASEFWKKMQEQGLFE